MNPFRVNPMITLIDENMEIDQEIDKMIMVLESQTMPFQISQDCL
jgi:hypothetical protein